MRHGDDTICSEVYAELRPNDGHRSFIDHLFVLRSGAGLTGVGRYLFASPFSEIALVSRRSPHGAQDRYEASVWKAVHLPARFGRQPRRQNFQGWIVGMRCRPLDAHTADAALVGLSEHFSKKLRHDDSVLLDPLIDALDSCVEHLRPGLDTAAAAQSRSSEIADALGSASSASEQDGGTSVVSLAASLGITPRTLQRHCRKRTGLTPKRYAAIQRFSSALRQVALERESLAHIASSAGYSDQAHMTTDLDRHAGLSPGKLRAVARRQVVRDAVRFFQDRDLQNRVRLLVCDADPADREEADEGDRTKQPRLRLSCPDELRTPKGDGDAED